MSKFVLSSAVATGVAMACPLSLADPASAKGKASLPTALLYGSVENELLDPIHQQMRVRHYKRHGAGLEQQLRDVDLVIVDGDHFTPQQLQRDPIAGAALRAGKWVLALDVTAEHKRVGLGQYLLGSSHDDDQAFLAHIGLNAKGRPRVHMIGLKTRTVLPGTESEGPCHEQQTEWWNTGKPNPKLKAGRDWVTRMVEHVGGTAAPGPDDQNIPPDLLHAEFQVERTYPEQTGPNIRYVQSDGSLQPPYEVYQYPSIQVRGMMRVFYANADTPPFQVIISELNYVVDPDHANFTAYRFDGYTREGEWTELSWFQTKFTTSLAGPAGFALQAASPATVNGSTDVTSGVNYSISFSPEEGPNAQFGYSSSTTNHIQDWKETNDVAGNQSNWHFRTASPLDADAQDYYCEEQSNFYGYGCFPGMLPNDLSLDTMQQHTSVVWSNQAIVDDVVHVTGALSHEMLQLYCPEDELSGLYTCIHPHAFAQAYNHTFDYALDVGAVLPIPITGMSFLPDVTPPNQPTSLTGTVVLQSPARADITVKLQSNSPNATVLPTMTIKQGQTSGTFQVLTNYNGLACGQSTTATLMASYGADFQAQLQVQNETCAP
ncbi:MAG: hypothetical protein QM778_04685 [Myxococcales bacterium]